MYVCLCVCKYACFYVSMHVCMYINASIPVPEGTNRLVKPKHDGLVSNGEVYENVDVGQLAVCNAACLDKTPTAAEHEFGVCAGVAGGCRIRLKNRMWLASSLYLVPACM